MIIYCTLSWLTVRQLPFSAWHRSTGWLELVDLFLKKISCENAHFNYSIDLNKLSPYMFQNLLFHLFQIKNHLIFFLSQRYYRGYNIYKRIAGLKICEFWISWNADNFFVSQNSVFLEKTDNRMQQIICSFGSEHWTMWISLICGLLKKKNYC